MAGHVKVSFLDSLKELYPNRPNRFYPYVETTCPNCSETVNIEYQIDAVKDLYHIRVKCNACPFLGFTYITYEATLHRELKGLIHHVVMELLSVDLIAETERELELELKSDGLPF